jgi:pyridoxamine 5'-phosphate oxidase-like protein
MTAIRTNEVTHPTAGELGALPEWPGRTIAVLATLGDDQPHAIPVSAPIRAGGRRILLSLHRSRDSLGRLREHPRVALTILASGDIAFTARGSAHIIQEPMIEAPDYAGIAIDVEHIDDHRQPAFQVQAGVDRRWVEESERDALRRRVSSLTELAAS